MKKLIGFCFVISFFCVFFSSCVSSKVEIPVKTNFYGVEIKTPKKQNYKIKLYGTLKGDNLEVVTVYWFDNWANGWTEARFAATGNLKITPDNSKTVKYEVINPVVLEYPEAAKIRYKDTYLIDDDALKALNNRLSRIESINELIEQELYDYDYFEFELKVGEKFFPEKYKKSKTFADLNVESEKVFGDGTYWNVEYTQSVFPEYMWETRTSGTLYRDWEEAFDLIYVTYIWNKLFGVGVDGSLQIIKTKPI